MAYTESNEKFGVTRTLQQTWTDRIPNYYDYTDWNGNYVKVEEPASTYVRKSVYKQYYDGPRNVAAIHDAEWTYVDRNNDLTSVQDGKITYHGSAAYCFPPYEPTPVKQPDTTNIVKRANNSVISALKGKKAHIPLIIAESRKTCNMFIDTAHTLAKVINTVRRGPRAVAYGLQQFSNPRKTLDTLTTAQLAKEYGIKPLLMDLDASVKSLAELSYRPEYLTVTSSGKETCTTLFTPPPDIGPRYRSSSYAISYSYKIWIEALVDPGFQHSAAGFGLVNPLELAWELTPYSFIADWFLPIGDLFGSLDATYGLTFSKGYSTSKSVNEYKRGSFEQKITSYSRSKIETFPAFSVILSPDLSHQRLANAMSLLSKALNRRS